MNPEQPTIVIVGGVAGGASAATRARRMNEHARIILIEKDEYISFANCGLPYYIGGEITDRNKLLVATPELLRDRFNIEVLIRHEVRAIHRATHTVQVHDRVGDRAFEITYDKLILAPGATPLVPPIPGMDAANVFTLRNLRDTDRIKAFVDACPNGRAVVVGAGFIGLEMVEMFHRLGLHVDLVELQPQVLPPLDGEMAHMVQATLLRHGVTLHLGTGLKGFEQDGDRVSLVILDNGKKLPADLVMVGIGVRPNVGLAKDAGLELGDTGGIRVNDSLQTSDPDIYAVGDAVEYRHAVADILMRIPLAGPANRAGRLAGEHAATGHARPMPNVLGTSIVRVFDTVAAVTGCNERCVKRLGGQAHQLYVAGNHHVGYYPGAEQMVIKLLYQPETRLVLGAQIVGGAGVDKRIDVIATVIQLGGTIDQLTELDLAYAPPFGAAKDPVHMAGFAAQNELDGLVAIASPADPLDGRQVVDVRNPDEVSRTPCPNALNIPLNQLRQRMDEIDRTRPVLVTCGSGQRSYIAARILQQHGFTDVTNVTGGALLRCHTQPHLFNQT